MQASDCSDPITTCASGHCQVVLCYLGDISGGVPAADPCNDGGGTCVSNELNIKKATPLFGCVRPGSGTSGSCVWPSYGSSAPAGVANGCPLGQVCNAQTLLNGTALSPFDVPAGSYLGSCAQACDPSGSGPRCPSGQTCNATALMSLLGLNPNATGFCSPRQGTCSSNAGLTEYLNCKSSAQCACPQSCVADLFYTINLGSNVCEAPCSTDADCPSAGDVCQGNTCINRLCGNTLLPDGGLAAPGFFQSCAWGSGTGFCVPSASLAIQALAFQGCVPGSAFLGVCYRSGTAGASCDPTLPNDPTKLCPAGQFCRAGTCLTLCDPTGAAGCAQGVACSPLNDNPQAGVCSGSCLDAGATCTYNGSCCSRNCNAYSCM
jgi:hypothetical protein